MKKIVLLLSLFAVSSNLYAQKLSIKEKGRYTDGRLEALEIVAYDSTTRQLFITNAATDSIDIIDVSNAALPNKVGGIDITPYGSGVNSVVNLKNGYIAAAIEANVKQDSGSVVIFTTSGLHYKTLKVGALPDMVMLTNDRKKILVACEGEPNDDYTVDPEGCIGIIDISSDFSKLDQSNVKLLRFTDAPISIPGSLKKPGTSWAEDLEPEYITDNETSTLAFVSCQEANVMITIDLITDRIIAYKGMGFKDHSLPSNSLDVSDKDGGINMANYPIKGVYMPDAIAAYTIAGKSYIVTANEGDSRDYKGYSSEARVKNLKLDETIFPNSKELKADSVLGRLKTLTADMGGDIDGDGDVDVIYTYGARSFSIWDESGMLVYDSGNDFETYFKDNYPKHFNCDEVNADNFDTRSDDKGVEPEAVTIGRMGEHTYAFVGLERQGGIMVYDITNPTAPVFETYISPYDSLGNSIDKAPEGLIFIPANENHTGKHLLIASHEVSGTTTIFEIEDLTIPPASILEHSKSKLNIYPNPSTGIIYVSLEEFDSIAKSIQIFDLIGNCVAFQNINFNTGNILEIDLSHLSKGSYLLQIQNQENKFQVQSFQLLK
jgi:DNA-binding beta-propeller fold protein YncE